MAPPPSLHCQPFMQDFLSAVERNEAAQLTLAHNNVLYVPGSDILVVTFMALLESKKVPEAEAQTIWAGSFLTQRQYSVLGVNRQRNDWYRSPDLHQVLRALAQQGFFARYRKVMFYGGSMGGFAALAFAELAPGCIVLAHNPQSTLRACETPWETRFQVAQEYDWEGDFSDGAVGARHAAVVYASYDPYCRGDKLHVDRLDPANLVRLRIPYVGHQVPHWLLQLKVLGPVFDEALAGQLTSARFRALVRQRPSIGRYWQIIAERQPNAAKREYCAEKARGLSPWLPEPQELLWKITAERTAGLAQPGPGVVIWAHDDADARRLASWLRAQAPALPLLDQPFDDPARPHKLSELIQRSSHVVMVQDEIRRWLTGRPVLIHRVQKGAQRFDQALLDALAESGYAHALLSRRQCRLPAAAQGQTKLAPPIAALPTTAKLLRDELASLCLIQQCLLAKGVTPQPLLIDTLPPHGDETAGWLATLEHMSLARPACEAALPSLSAEPTGWGSGADLCWWPGVAQGQAAVRTQISIEPPSSARLDQLDALLTTGSSVAISGLAVAPKGTAPDAVLTLRQGNQVQTPRWGQASPGGPQVFPGHPNAGQARFGPMPMQADPAAPIQLMLGPVAQPGLTLATIRFEPLTERRAVRGLYLAPWSLGYLPLPGAASVAISHALHRWLPQPAPLGLSKHEEFKRYYAERYSDISGASYRFSVVAEPVARFIALYRHAKEAGGWGRLLSGAAEAQAPSLETLMANFDEYAQDPVLARWFAPQATLLAEAGPLEAVFSLAEPQRMREALAQVSGRPFEWEERKPGLLARWGLKKHSEAPRAVSDWVLERYAEDLRLYQQGA